MQAQFLRSIILLPLLFGCGQTAAGKLYEWIDQHGARHFSDHAPQAIPYSEKTPGSASGSRGTGSVPGIRPAERDLLESSRKRQARLKQARQAAARSAEEHRKQCEQAQARYHASTRSPGSAVSGEYKALLRRMNRRCD